MNLVCRHEPITEAPISDGRAKAGSSGQSEQPSAFRSAPGWSPLSPDARLPEPFGLIFPREYFVALRSLAPSVTALRLFSERIGRLRKRGLAPEWMPDKRFSPDDWPHLIALALTEGASAGLDLADVIAPFAKVARKLADAATLAGENLRKADIDSGIFKALVLYSATSMVGLPRSRYSYFFQLIYDEEVNSLPSVVALFDWVSSGIDEDVMREMAAKSQEMYADDDTYVATALFLHPDLNRINEEIDRSLAEQASSEGTDLEESLPPSISEDFEVVLRTKTPEPRPIPLGPRTPDGVVLTERARREIQGERFFARDRLEDGLSLLGSYRAMRTGRQSRQAFNEEAHRKRFVEAPCFSDPGSLKAFRHDYTVTVGRKSYVMDRHLKWGKGNNPISAMRIYFAWDDETEEVIVGSAPRHLPMASYS